MTQTACDDPVYVMGRSEAESRRLMLQARLYDRITRRFLQDAGLTAGMTVLDVGSGAGDVAFAAADLVGPTGRVVGVDANPVVLETARARARAEQRSNVTFVAGDCSTAEFGCCPDGITNAKGHDGQGCRKLHTGAGAAGAGGAGSDGENLTRPVQFMLGLMW